MHIDEIDTPSLVVDLDIMEANIRIYQSYFDQHGIGLRPHIKTHKIPDLARQQVAAGAIGITCAKLGEVEVMAEAGLEDILLFFNIVGAQKLRRLAQLAQQCVLTTTVDDPIVADAMNSCGARHGVRFRVLAELGSYNQRTGTPTVRELVELAQFIEQCSHLVLKGIAIYPSGAQNRDLIEEAGDAFRKHGLCLDIVSGGGSPAAFEAHTIPYLTEHRAGTYIFHDKLCVDRGFARIEACALRIVTTVVSRPVPERGVLDGGTKTFSADGSMPRGLVVNCPGAEIYKTNEEHGYLDISRCPDPPVIGSRIWVIPNHVCVAVNLHDQVYGIRGENVEQVWSVAARGKLY